MNFAVRGTRFARRRNVVAAALASLAVAGLVAPLASGRPEAPGVTDERIAVMVSALMENRHLSQMHLDDEIAKRALEDVSRDARPHEALLLPERRRQFTAESARIDDYVKRGDVRFAKRIFDVFLDRVDDRTASRKQMVDAKHDFTIDESMDRDPKKIEWMTSKEEADERWRKRVKYDLLLQTSDDDVSDEEAHEKLHKRYRSIGQRWTQTDNDELLEMYLSAITQSFDPHSSYMSPRSLADFEIQMRLELDGIGASLESKYGETVVRHIVPGGAADKDGRLKVDDVITGVGQGDDWRGDRHHRHEANRRGGEDPRQTGDHRAPGGEDGRRHGTPDLRHHPRRIELKDSEARSEILERGPHGEDMGPQASNDAPGGTTPGSPEEPSGHVIERSQADGTVFRIGVIGLPSFYMDMEGRRQGREDYKSTTRDVRRLLEEFKTKNVDVVVVDLRLNGGGSLTEAVDTTGLFIDQGPVVQVKGPDGKTQPYPDQDPGAVWNGPLVVMINKFSASASEIFAGAIQDYGRGIVVGDHSTHGKGTVQQLEELGRVIPPDRRRRTTAR